MPHGVYQFLSQHIQRMAKTTKEQNFYLVPSKGQKRSVRRRLEERKWNPKNFHVSTDTYSNALKHDRILRYITNIELFQHLIEISKTML